MKKFSFVPNGKCLMTIRQRVLNWANGNGQKIVPLWLTITFCESWGSKKPALSAVLYKNVSGYLERKKERNELNYLFIFQFECLFIHQTDVAGIRSHVMLLKSDGFQDKRGSKRMNALVWDEKKKDKTNRSISDQQNN